MSLPTILFIGTRYTRVKRSNHFISFISLVSIIGLTLGVAVLITVLSVMNGFDRELRQRILGMVPHATISSYAIIDDWESLGKSIGGNPQVEAYAPFTQLQGLLTAQGQVAGAAFFGIDPVYEKRVSIIDQHMVEGSIDRLTSGGFDIVLGKDLVDGLGLRLGDYVTVVLPEATASPAGLIPRFKRFKLAGIFSVGADIDSTVGYINLHDAARLLRLPDGAQGIRIKVNDIFKAPQVAQNIVTKLHGDYYISDWTATHGNLFQAIKMEKTLVGLLLFMIVVVAAFNIVSSLVMVVTDKKSDIAILQTIGATPKQIQAIFMIQGLIIGVSGTVLGTVLGIIAALNIGPLLNYINGLFHLQLFNAYFVNYLPSELRFSNVALIVSASFILCFLATLYPARRAAKIDPVEVLRHE